MFLNASAEIRDKTEVLAGGTRDDTKTVNKAPFMEKLLSERKKERRPKHTNDVND